MPMHENRAWFARRYDDPAHVAEMLADGRTWTLCTAVHVHPPGEPDGGVIFLNDATCEDGAGEYAAIDAKTGRQFESITFSWCSVHNAAKHIRECLLAAQTREWPVPSWWNPDPAAAAGKGRDWRELVTYDDGHRCYLCA